MLGASEFRPCSDGILRQAALQSAKVDCVQKLDPKERAAIFHRLARIQEELNVPNVADNQKADLELEYLVLTGKILNDDSLN